MYRLQLQPFLETEGLLSCSSAALPGLSAPPPHSSATLRSQRLDTAGPSRNEGFTHNTALQPQQPGLF